MHDIFTWFLLVYQRSMSSLALLYLCRQQQCIWTLLQSMRHLTRCKHSSFSLGQTRKSESLSEILKQQNLQDILWGLHIFQKCLGLMFSNKLEPKIMSRYVAILYSPLDLWILKNWLSISVETLPENMFCKGRPHKKSAVIIISIAQRLNGAETPSKILLLLWIVKDHTFHRYFSRESFPYFHKLLFLPVQTMICRSAQQWWPISLEDNFLPFEWYLASLLVVGWFPCSLLPR